MYDTEKARYFKQEAVNKHFFLSVTLECKYLYYVDIFINFDNLVKQDHKYGN